MQSVPDFYRGRNIFLTGATGFIGKVLLEKLLRCCPDVGTLYILVRPKRGQAAQDRLEELIKSKVFDKLRNENPNFGDKLYGISGDLMEPEMGISAEEQQLMIDNVNIVFHSAATVRFDEVLRLALEMNVIAVKKIIALCRKLRNLDVLVHVSTAYANCDRHFIEEVVYPPPCDPNKLIEAAEWMTDEMLNKITPLLKGEKPNTYTYTKQLAEHIVITEAKDLPIAIVRPSIVGAAWREPVPGWIDNLNGPGGLYVAAGKGLLKTSKVDPHVYADLIPVDLCVNMIIASAWHSVVHKPKEILIYHTTVSNDNPITWGEMEPVVMKYWKTNPLDNCFRRPKTVLMTKEGLLHNYWVLVSHLIPAYLTDFGLRCIGQKPRMVRIFEKVHRIMGTLEYFTNRQWEWTHHNRDVLLSKLGPEDKKTFYLDPRPLHWPTYLETYCLGAKMYTLQEDLSGLPAARAHIRKLRNIRYTFNTIIVVILWRLLVARSQIARNLWFFIMGLVFKFVQNFHITSTIQR